MRQFRCFEAFETEFAEDLHFITGPNGRGKTSLIEAVCVLLRLQSPRVSQLARVVQHGAPGFSLEGHWGERHLAFHYSAERKRLLLDDVEQTRATEYLQQGRVVWFSNSDIELAKGAGEVRRRYLDFFCAQYDTLYRSALRQYQVALRSRNQLLKQPYVPWREVAAFDAPLIEHGVVVSTVRSRFLEAIRAPVEAAHRRLSGGLEQVSISSESGWDTNSPESTLRSARGEDARLRQTTCGPHRDDFSIRLSGGAAAGDMSEGQQRTVALALKLAATEVLHVQDGVSPLLLIDDVFGELDRERRGAFLASLPANSQKLVTTTFLDWVAPEVAGARLDLGPQSGE